MSSIATNSFISDSSIKIRRELLPNEVTADILNKDIILRTTFQKIFLKKTIRISNKDYVCDVYKAITSIDKKKDVNYYFIIFNDGHCQIKIIDEIFFGEVTFYDLVVGDIVLEDSVIRIKNILSTIDNKTSKISNELEIDFSLISDEKIILEFF